jgi:hypothetical protein
LLSHPRFAVDIVLYPRLGRDEVVVATIEAAGD